MYQYLEYQNKANTRYERIAEGQNASPTAAAVCIYIYDIYFVIITTNNKTKQIPGMREASKRRNVSPCCCRCCRMYDSVYTNVYIHTTKKKKIDQDPR